MQKLSLKIVAIIILVAVVYFATKEVQTYLGKNAISNLPFIVHSLDDAKALAASENKLILANYSATWCPTCRKLDTQVFTSDSVAKIIKEKFIFTRLDFDTEAGAEFAKTHNLVGFPRVLVLASTGESIVEMPLVFEAEEYSRNLGKVIARY